VLLLGDLPFCYERGEFIMIKYEKANTEGSPPDVEMITDDADGEMIALEEMIKEAEFEGIILPPDRSVEDGNFHILIPGKDVGEFSDAVWDIDRGLLENKIEMWNAKALEDAENN
jgi:hypothetical protein